MQDIDEDMAEAFDLETDKGVIVDDVIDDSPADDAGLRSNDVIISFDDNEIEDIDDLNDRMRDYDPGDEVEVKILRRGKEKTYTVELGRERDRHRSWSFHFDDDDWNIPGVYGLSNWSDDRGGYLGVFTMELSDQLMDYFDTRFGVLVTEVEEDSPAEEAGLKAGDVILNVDRERVDSPGDLREVIRDHEAGDEVEIVVVRKGEEMTISANLDEADDYSYGGNYLLGVPSMPSMPSLPSLPSLPGLDNYYLGIDEDDFDDIEIDMEELREELKELQKELKVIKEKLD
jgi:serine protease Do